MNNHFGGAVDLFNIHQARMVAHELLLLPEVLSIELYGGIARGQEDEYIRLVIVVNQKMYESYNALFQTTFQEERENDTDLSQVRKIAAITLWGKDWPDFHLWEEQLKIDLLVMPADWRTRSYSLSKDIYASDAEFLRNVERAAQTIVSNSLVIVSTDNDLRRLIRSTLTTIRYQYEVHGSTGGQDHAVSVVSRLQPNRLVVDIDGNIGIEFIRRARMAGYLFPVCLIHTNPLDELDVRWATETLSVTTIIQKPISEEILRVRLVEYLTRCSQ